MKTTNKITLISRSFLLQNRAGPRLRWLWSVLAVLWCPGMNLEAAIFEWDPSPEPEVVGYKLYYGTSSGNYTVVIDAGNVTEASVGNMFSTNTYYLAVTAYTAEGLESLPSVELMILMPAPLNLAVMPLTPAELLALLPGNPPSVNVNTYMLREPAEGFSFVVTGDPQKGLTIFASSDLAAWTTVGSVPNPTGAVKIRELEGGTLDRRFFKVEQVDIDVVLE